MLYARQEKVEKISIKIGIKFSKLGLSPNQWTLLTIIPAMLSFYFIIIESFLLAALFLIIATFIDVVDGSVARVTGRVTKLGAYLDTIMDRYVEAVVILGLFLISLPSFILPAYFWIGLFIFGSLMTTYAKAAAKEKELAEKELRGGLLERAERMILLFIGIVLAYFSIVLLVYTIALLAVLSNVSAIQRIYYAVSKKS